MGPADGLTRLEGGQIAAHGGDGDPNMLGKFFQGSEFGPLQIGFDLRLALLGLHVYGIFWNVLEENATLP